MEGPRRVAGGPPGVTTPMVGEISRVARDRVAMSDIWNVLSSLASAGATVFAAVALFQTARTSKRAETFQHLRDVNSAIAALGDVDVSHLQHEILAYMEHGLDDLSPNGTKYKQFLDTLELFSFAAEKHAVDSIIASEYLRSIVRGHMVPTSFLNDYQRVAKNPYCYEYLFRLAKREQQRLPPMKGYDDV